jgi:hypothetical protein
MNPLRAFLSVATLASILATAPGCVVVDHRDSTLTIDNDSSYVLEEIRLAQVDTPSWGPNVVPDLLYPGESVTVYDIRCDYYDVLVVDETGLECVLYDLDLCFSDRRWIVSDSTLNACAFKRRPDSEPASRTP